LANFNSYVTVTVAFVFRDLKPGNVLLSKDSAVAKVADFGGSKLLANPKSKKQTATPVLDDSDGEQITNPAFSGGRFSMSTNVGTPVINKNVCTRTMHLYVYHRMYLFQSYMAPELMVDGASTRQASIGLAMVHH
jgi:serine/threonine protein kinase